MTAVQVLDQFWLWQQRRGWHGVRLSVVEYPGYYALRMEGPGNVEVEQIERQTAHCLQSQFHFEKGVCWPLFYRLLQEMRRGH